MQRVGNLGLSHGGMGATCASCGSTNEMPRHAFLHLPGTKLLMLIGAEAKHRKINFQRAYIQVQGYQNAGNTSLNTPQGPHHMVT